MDDVLYPRSRFLDLLELDDETLRSLEAESPLKELGGARESYPIGDLSAYRRHLGSAPERQPCRRQLFLNFKGGTGKTSLSVSYAHRLAELGHRVLLIDLDSQGHASKCVGMEGETFDNTLYEVLVKKKSIAECRVQTALEELHLVPSNLRMATVDLALMPLSRREYRLTKAISAIEDEYDYVIMDAPPSFGLLNLNAIVAAQELFVPVLPDFLSFHGLKLLFETLDDIEEDLEHRLDQIFVVINQFNPTTKIARAAREALSKHYADFLVPHVVRQCTKFAQASGEGCPIFAFDATSRAAHDVQALIAHTRRRPAQTPELKEQAV